jgi:2,4-dienoyl-CoA reductase-like NADH-dependent reductase (Old Yellow Enzyme family)
MNTSPSAAGSSVLFSPLEVRSLKFKNRIFLSPMCQYSAVDGLLNDWHQVHYASRAVGGAACVMIEATAVTPEGRISPADSGLWNDSQIAKLQAVTSLVKKNGAIPAIQLAHAGRKASAGTPWEGGKPLAAPRGWQTVAPSALAFADGWPTPHALSENEIAQHLNHFVHAAKRSFAAGFEVIELHMAHGYLMHQFLSPLTNQRKDQYGGSLENRMRFPLEVAAAVRAVWPQQLPLFVRVSATDWVDGGWDLESTITLARKLKECGVDFIDCSTGGLVPNASIPLAPGYQVSFARGVREKAGILTGAVGLITEAKQAEEIVASGSADAIFIGRELLRNPYWPMQAAKVLNTETPWPRQYDRARL